MKKSNKLFLLIFAILLVLPFASALDFDNAKIVGQDKLTIDVVNGFNIWPFNNPISTLKLYPQYEHARIDSGSDSIFAEINFTNYGDYNQPFGNMEFYDLNRWDLLTGNYLRISRPVHWQYSTIEMQESPIIVNSCETIQDENGSRQQCNQQIVGTHQVPVKTWHDFSSSTIPAGQYNLGISTYVLPEDHIEWIPTIQGVKITEWADFSANTLYEQSFNATGATYGNGLNSAAEVYQNITVGADSPGGNVSFTVKGIEMSGYSLVNGTMNITIWNSTAVGRVGAALWTNGSITVGAGGCFASPTDNLCNITLQAMGTTTNANAGQKLWIWATYSAGGNSFRINETGAAYKGGEIYGCDLNQNYVMCQNRSISMRFRIFGNPVSTASTINTTLTLPTNYFNTSNPTITFNSTILTSFTNITNATTYFYYGTNFSVFGTNFSTVTGNASQGVTNFTSVIRGGFPDGNYTYNVYSCSLNNTGSNCAWAVSNFTFTVDATVPVPSYTSPTVANNTYQNFNNTIVNVTFVEQNPDTLIINIFNSSGLFNQSFTKVLTANGSYSLNFTNMQDGVYRFNTTLNDTYGNKNNTDTRTIIIDTLLPVPSFVSPTPVNGTVQSATFVTLNLSVTELYPHTYTINFYNSSGLYNSSYRISSIVNGSYFINITGLIDGTYLYNGTVNDSAANKNNTNTRTIIIDNLSPNISIQSPSNNQIFVVQTNISLNITATDLNRDSCWYNLDNGSANVTIPGCTNSSVTITESADHNLLVFTNDSVNHISLTSVNFTQVNFTTGFASSAIETSSQSYNLTVNATASVTIGNVRLVYNGTNYTTTTLNSRDYNTTLDVPVINATNNVTLTWLFSAIFKSTSQNTTSVQFNQSVSLLNLSLCNSGNNVQLVNYSVVDEDTYAALNASFQTTFNYWTGSGRSNKTYSFQDLTQTVDKFTFCGSQNTTYKVMDQVLYTANSYSSRNYYLIQASLNNNSQQLIYLPLLLSNSSSSFTITVLNNVAPLANALVVINKYYVGSGIYKQIGQATTDADGKFAIDLVINGLYQFITSSNNVTYPLVSKVALCDVSPCEMTINLLNNQTSLLQPFYDQYAVNIVSNLSFNPNNNIVSYSFLDTSGLANYFRMEVDQTSLNTSTAVICNQQIFSSSGYMSCNVTGYEGDFQATTYISRSPEKIDKTLDFIIAGILSTSTGLGLMAIIFCLGWIITITFAGAAVSRGNPSATLWAFQISFITAKFMTVLPFSWVVVSLVEISCLWIQGRVKS